MKGFILTAVVFTAMGCSSALVQPAAEANKAPFAAEAVENDYREVSLNDLNNRVQTAIKSFEISYIVEKIERSATKRHTRVMLEEKDSTTTKVVILDDEGNEVKSSYD